MKGVVYFNHGTKYLARLAVSLWTLREHFGGLVTILDTGHDQGLLANFASDKRLGVSVRKIPLAATEKNACYVTKASLWRHIHYEHAVFLDADTAVKGSINPLFNFADEHGFVVTRFSNWTTTGHLVSKRLRRWKNIRCEGMHVGLLLYQSLDAPHAAINTGVVAWRRGAAFLEKWEALSAAGWSCPFTDELAAQLLLRRCQHVMVNERFNASPMHRKCPSDDVVVHHFHGDKHTAYCRANGVVGQVVWLPLITDVIRHNVANINDWIPAGDTGLETLLQNRVIDMAG